MNYVEPPWTWHRGRPATYEAAHCGYCGEPCMVPVMPKKVYHWQTFAPPPPASCSASCRLRNNQWESWIRRSRIEIFAGTISQPPDVASLPFAKRAQEAIVARTLSVSLVP